MPTERTRRNGLPCPLCGCRLSYVVRTTLHGDVLHRRRKCDAKGHKFTTKEHTAQKVTDMSVSIREAIDSIPQIDATGV